MQKLIITAAITGGEGVSKEITPYVPCTIDEIIEETVKCRRAGAAIVHLHAKDPETGRPASDPNTIFREYIRGIRESEASDIIINITTGGGRADPTKVDEIMKERIGFGEEMCSLNMGSLNFWAEPMLDLVFENPLPRIQRWATFMLEKGVKPELEIYDTGMINTALMLAERGVLKKPLHFQFVMVGTTGMSPSLQALLYCLQCIPSDSTWSVCALGRHEIPIATMAMLLGGHVRVGMEDNIYLEKGILAKSNAELVSKVVRLAKELGISVATPDEAREILNIKKAS
jgi:3-keto-5-aminohexanoate cleavage enzyme